jgi:hypothetical protein
MAKSVPPPPGLEIASLRHERERVYNLMAPGSGTPWEDRGALGSLKAFFATAKQSLFSPRVLLDSIRRPETLSDAYGFVIGCGLVLSVSALMHCAIYAFWNRDALWEGFWVQASVGSVAMPVILFAIMKVFTFVYVPVIGVESKARVPLSLAYNVLGYLLGCSILALIPIVGPPLAALWFMIVVIVAGSRYRLHIGWGGAIIATALSMAVCSGVVTAAYYLVKLAMRLWLGI